MKAKKLGPLVLSLKFHCIFQSKHSYTRSSSLLLMMHPASILVDMLDILRQPPQQTVLAENKKSGALKLFCGSQKAIVLPQQESTSHSEREIIDLSFTVSQQ